MTERSTRQDARRAKTGLGLVAGLAMLTATLAHAQVLAPVGTMPDGSRHPIASAAIASPSQPQKADKTSPPNAAQPAPASATQAPSLRDEPPQPAVIQLKDGKLSIEASNSGLDDILHAVAAKSGMHIEGLDRDYRVFGQYGPANPREVLSELLSDSGLNIVMIGATPDGAPKQLLLSSRGDAPPTPPNPNDPQEAFHPLPPTVYHEPSPEPQPRDRNRMGRGANPRNGVRTPQQILQELELLHQQQQNQQGSPQ